MSDIERLRAQAAHARRLAESITDMRALAALHAFADEVERKAAEIEHQQSIEGGKPSSRSRSDTP